jgi:hypothetical protein
LLKAKTSILFPFLSKTLWKSDSNSPALINPNCGNIAIAPESPIYKEKADIAFEKIKN